MKKGLLKLLLPILLIALCLGGVPACALAADGTSAEAKSVEFEKTFSETVTGGGLASYASGPQNLALRIRALNLRQFPGSYGAQLTGFDALAGTIYDQMADYYVVNGGTDTLQLGSEVEISFTGAGTIQGVENNSTYLNKKSELGYAVTSAYCALLYDHPELFWIYSMKYSWTVSGNNTTNGFSAKIGKITITFEETYNGAKSNIAAFDAAVESAVNAIKSRRGSSTAPYQTLKTIHDYVCEHITYPSGYNLSSPTPVYHSAAGMFLNVTGGYGVCECYAKSFMILCRKFNIPAVLVVGDVTQGGKKEPHMWNYVQIGGYWYVVDATWDDSTGGAISDAYFLIGQSTLDSKPARSLNKYFSAGGSSKSFTYPTLSGTDYLREQQSTAASMDAHQWETLKTVQPTCTAVGVRIDQCTVCGDIRRTVTAAALGHSFQQQSRTEPTCTLAGEIVSACSRCKLRQSTEIPALGHDFSGQEGVYNNDATTTSDGTKTLTCKRGCGATMTVTAVGTKLSVVATPAPAPAPVVAVPAPAPVQPAAAAASSGLSASSVKSLVLQGSQSTSVLKVGKVVAGEPVVRIESLSKKLVKVTSGGKIKALKKSGTAKLRITLASGRTMTVKVKLQSGTVKTKKITGVPKSLTLGRGASLKLSPTLSPITSQQKLSYSSSNKKVVTVSSSGKLKAKKAGRAFITVKSGSKTVKCTVTVN